MKYDNKKKELFEILNEVKNDNINYRKAFLTRDEWKFIIKKKIDLLIKYLTFDPEDCFYIEQFATNEKDLIINDILDVIENGSNKMGFYSTKDLKKISDFIKNIQDFEGKKDIYNSSASVEQLIADLKERAEYVGEFIILLSKFVPLALQDALDNSGYFCKNDITELILTLEKKLKAQGD